MGCAFEGCLVIQRLILLVASKRFGPTKHHRERAQMSLLKKLFGGSDAAKEPEFEEYEGFRIYPEPMKESGGYRLAARIEKEVDGEARVHRLIRADVFNASEGAAKAALDKAKILIDQMGEKLFD